MCLKTKKSPGIKAHIVEMLIEIWHLVLDQAFELKHAKTQLKV